MIILHHDAFSFDTPAVDLLVREATLSTTTRLAAGDFVLAVSLNTRSKLMCMSAVVAATTVQAFTTSTPSLCFPQVVLVMQTWSSQLMVRPLTASVFS